jgi:hypothetical protein
VVLRIRQDISEQAQMIDFYLIFENDSEAKHPFYTCGSS